MAKKSIRERLEKLESECKFLDWFVSERFWATLTREELETWASGGNLPDPIPNRPSSLDTLDRKSLLKLWEGVRAEIWGAQSRRTGFLGRQGLLARAERQALLFDARRNIVRRMAKRPRGGKRRA